MIDASLLNGVEAIEVQVNDFLDKHGNPYHTTKVIVTGHNSARVTRLSGVMYGCPDRTACKLLRVNGPLKEYCHHHGIALLQYRNGYTERD